MALLKRHFLWVIYSVFVIAAMTFHQSESWFISQGPLPYGKPIIWFILVMFLAYSLYCHCKEDFFKTMGQTGKYYWTKQIGIDLYLGVALIGSLIYFNEGSLWILMLWLVPLILFANLATLLYLALNYDGVMAHFI